ncbi:DUF4442 domain-containing protein [Legionella spiritensis]|uniref:DUF4442 domain-containing protein n=1 Tax=Legionella spiritensis TaxID=452 RepID=A0A0W0ZB15_LEGSP|nr:DUF4442 domain-containing protein [Legionella spiritensis]KTD66349.1 hypothetical protein Lspi_0112 [Legionella spiritensis]SNV48744.1 Uncharacterised protein [Legionella spiritensis]VEG91561.1 Uncharacterised protein [Legionella spiritensis]
MKLSARQLRWLLNAWPPFWGAGIKVEHISADFSLIRVSLAFRWYNKNYMRVQYGGSLYSMTDPFFVLILIKKLGPDYIAWDKHAEIKYIKPGKSRVYAEFTITEQQITDIKNAAEHHEKTLPVFHTTIYDQHKEAVASVKKTVYVKRIR